jgi:hypothetical protein
MALPEGYEELVNASDVNASAWRLLGEWLGEREGWHFAKLPAEIGPGLWWFGDWHVARVELRPWAGRYETTVNYVAGGDDTQIFFDDFALLKQWVEQFGEPHVGG